MSLDDETESTCGASLPEYYVQKRSILRARRLGSDDTGASTSGEIDGGHLLVSVGAFCGIDLITKILNHYIDREDRIERRLRGGRPMHPGDDTVQKTPRSWADSGLSWGDYLLKQHKELCAEADEMVDPDGEEDVGEEYLEGDELFFAMVAVCGFETALAVLAHYHKKRDPLLNRSEKDD